jgi:nucleotide-binding universal stress UspA family protein
MPQKGSRSIVVGIDFGPGGDKAILEGAKRVAEGQATELHAVHVLDWSKVCDHPATAPFSKEEEFLEQGPRGIRQRVEDIIRSQAIALPGEALWVHARIGETVDVLLQVAVECDADLIVVGSHARPRLARLLGSVSELLVRMATRAVLVARSDEHSMLLIKTERPAPPFSAGKVPACMAEPSIAGECGSVLGTLPAIERRDIDA